MKKIISTLILTLSLTAFAFAEDPIAPPNPNCVKGHINTPAGLCEPPPTNPRPGEEPDNGNRSAGDNSVVYAVENWILTFIQSRFF